MRGEQSCTGDGPPLVLGSARGLRAFTLDDAGYLRGISFPYVWSPGENVAKCFSAKPTDSNRAWYDHDIRDNAWVSCGVAFPFDAKQEPYLIPGWDWQHCEGLSTECGCGFYAYHDGGLHNYEDSMLVTGVVEGYGKVILGSQGYRATKARIIALAPPRVALLKRMDDVRESLDRLQNLLIDEEKQNRTNPLIQVAVRNDIMGLIRKTENMINRMSANLDKLHDKVNLMNQLYDVPIFQTKEEMLVQFPVDGLNGLL